MWKRYLWILIIVLLTTSCVSPGIVKISSPTASEETHNVPSLNAHFPQLLNTPTVFLDSPPIEGKLVLENGCLRVNEVENLSTGDNFLLIWDSRFSTITEQDIVHVVDSRTGNILASVGDYVAIGNGGTLVSPTIKPIPNECSEPYWVVGETIKKIDRP